MRYLSVCSGIEAASVAWHPLGWEPVAFSEIEPFPCSVLEHRFPGIPNMGDMTKFEEWDIEPGSIDVLVGGTPCQSFSIAGLRGGLEDGRGNLALTYCRILQKFKPRWFVWENVPGVLSSGGGRDFGSILGAMAELRYSFAWRVLDAQHFGVPQRRRRVFVVGYFGNWRRAGEVLFERGCVSGNPQKGSKKKQSVAALTATGVGTCGADDNQGQAGHLIAHSLRAEGFDASEDGTGRGTPLVAAIQERAVSTNESNGPQGSGFRTDGKAYTLEARHHVQAVAYRTAGDGGVYDEGDRTDPLTTALDPSANIVAFAQNQRDELRTLNVVGALAAEPGMKQQTYLSGNVGVRRLTPRECERLQGFPDDWTLVSHRGKMAADGPRYKAIGNSMAVPVMRWIGSRIANVG